MRAATDEAPPPQFSAEQVGGVWFVIVVVAVGVLVFNALVHLAFASVILQVFERRIPFYVEPPQPDPRAEPVAFSTSHELTLRGSLHRSATKPARGLVVFCPELGGSHWAAREYGRGLIEAGFNVLAFDFRNQGESDSLAGYDPLHWLTEYEVNDVLAAIRYAQGRPDVGRREIGLFGISRGGAAALAAAARTPEVRCVACESAFSTTSLMLHFTLRWSSMYVPNWVMRPIPIWHLRNTLRVVQWISGLRRGCRYTNLERWLPLLHDRPVLMIAGQADTYVLPEMTRTLCERIPAGCRQFWAVPGAKHNMARQADPNAYDRRLAGFFAALGDRT